MKPLDRRLLAYASAARAFFVVGGGLALVQTLSTIGAAWFLSRVIVAAIDGALIDEVAPDLALLVTVVVLRAATTWLLDVVAARGAAKVKSQLRQRVLASIARRGPGWRAERNSAAIATTVGPGLDALDGYFGRYLPQLILTAVATPIVVVVVVLQDFWSAVSIVVTLPLIPVFMILIGWATQKAQQAQWQDLGRLAGAFLDVVGGLATLKLFGRQYRQTRRIATITDDYRRRTMSVLRISFVSGFVLELASSLAVALVAVNIGIRLIDGSVLLGVGLFVLLLAPEAFLPLRNVGVQFHAAAEGVAAADDVFALLDEGQGADVRVGSVSDDRARGVADVGLRGDLVLTDLEIAYEDRIAVSGFSAVFSRGTVTALAGPSGAGKSSVIAALLGFVPFGGSIEFGGRRLGGQEPGGSAAEAIAWSGQRPGLSEGSLLENIALGSANPDPELARRALDLAAGDELDLELSLGVGGSGLSGGQAQRVSVARAFYRAMESDRPIVVLDEPSSALDVTTEARLAAGIAALAAQDRVVIVVTHRTALAATASHRVRLAPPVRVAVAGA